MLLHNLLALQTIFNSDVNDIAPSCPFNPPLTCENKTIVPDQCCFEYPGGIFLQSQFWNYLPSKRNLNTSELINELGPLDSFTVHGLWPDTCIGSYEQFCEKDMFIDDVYYLLHSDEFQGSLELYNFMKLYWKNNVVNNEESLWIHEYNKHGTCIKNIRPECYSRWNSHGNEKLWKRKSVIDYFNITRNLFQDLNSFEMLAKHGISPSINRTYTKREIQDALKDEFNGKTVFINCDSNNVLNEIWYFHLLNGPFLNEKFVPIDALESPPFSKCKATGIRYYPKGHIPSDDNGSDEKKGELRIVTDDKKNNGFLIKNGHWLAKGTPATFKLLKSPFGNYYLKSRLGYCRIHNDRNELFKCHYENTRDATQFEFDDLNSLIGYSNGFKWGSFDESEDSQREVYHLTDRNANHLKFKFQLKFSAL